jgi:inositol oxygenase
MCAKYHSFDHAKMTVWETFMELKTYVDSSDPDTELPNLEHMMQTAEAIRAAGLPEWFQLVGLVHDMGKAMFLWGTAEDGQLGEANFPQWSLGGDTWVVGCALPESAVMPHLNALNPDMMEARYSTPMGIYESGCGLHNLKYAYGHDEYMYQFLLHNKCKIPAEGLAMIRFHSCYPLHSGGDYERFMAPGDSEIMEWVRKFNKFDLFTKADTRPVVEELWPHYQRLIDKFMPGKLSW